MMDEIIIKKAEREDADEIIKLFNFYEDEEKTDRNYVESAIKQNENGTVSLIVAEVNEKIVGALKLKRKRSHIGNIGKVAVSPDFRRLGIGTLLYKVAMWIFSKEGRIKIADQMTEPNKPMKHLFEKLGFEKEGTLKMHTHDKKDVSLYAYFINEKNAPKIPENVKVKIELWKNE